jgi:hypothetical protein
MKYFKMAVALVGAVAISILGMSVMADTQLLFLGLLLNIIGSIGAGLIVGTMYSVWKLEHGNKAP